MVMETARTLLRPYRTSDVDRVFDIYSRWEVAKWLGADPKVMESREQAEKSVERLIARTVDPDKADDWSGFWAVERKADGVVAGTVLLVPLPDADGEVEIGWHFHPDSWGHGLASEAAAAVLTWGFGHGLGEIFAVVRPGNDPSMKLCRRIGMQHLGRTSKYYDAELELFHAAAPG